MHINSNFRIEKVARKFSFLDLMALSGPLVFSMGFVLADYRQFWKNLIRTDLDGSSFYIHRATIGLALLRPILLPSAIALLFLRLRHPRPNLRRIAMQPGFSANLAVITAVFCGLYNSMIQIFIAGKPWLLVLICNSWHGCGESVISVWFFLIVFGLMRPEKSWIDRTGFAFGILWILISAVPLMLDPWVDSFPATAISPIDLHVAWYLSRKGSFEPFHNDRIIAG